MTTTQIANTLRAHINALALELAAATTPAKIRALKIAIRTAEERLASL